MKAEFKHSDIAIRIQLEICLGSENLAEVFGKKNAANSYQQKVEFTC